MCSVIRTRNRIIETPKELIDFLPHPKNIVVAHGYSALSPDDLDACLC